MKVEDKELLEEIREKHAEYAKKGGRFDIGSLDNDCEELDVSRLRVSYHT